MKHGAPGRFLSKEMTWDSAFMKQHVSSSCFSKPFFVWVRDVKNTLVSGSEIFH